MANTARLIIVLSIIINIGNVISSSTNGCKTTSITRYGFFNKPFWRIDNPALKHVKLQKDGHDITYFEMHLTVKSQDIVTILLAHQGNKIDYHHDDYYFIKFTTSQVILSRKRNRLNLKYTPKLMSWNHYTQFYIKIVNDNLQFGILGQSPIISYTDVSVKSMQYFSFGGSNTDVYKPTEINFDCP